MTKEERKHYSSVHYYLKSKYGVAQKCESKKCKKISTTFQWAKIKGKEYDFKRKNFKQLCVSCHTLYDATEEKSGKLVKANIGKVISKEHRLKISNSLKGNKATERQAEASKIYFGKKVEKILDGKVIGTYSSVVEAEKSLGNKMCALYYFFKTRKSEEQYYKGFQWKIYPSKHQAISDQITHITNQIKGLEV